MDEEIEFSGFLKFADTEFQDFILPIIPASSQLSLNSALDANQLGKIPGKLTPDGWVGFHNWSNHRAKLTQLERWQLWQVDYGIVIPVGLNMYLHHALDLDTDDPEIAKVMEEISYEHLGVTTGHPLPLRQPAAPADL